MNNSVELDPFIMNNHSFLLGNGLKELSINANQILKDKSWNNILKMLSEKQNLNLNTTNVIGYIIHYLHFQEKISKLKKKKFKF